jgi:hypothetical protein
MSRKATVEIVGLGKVWVWKEEDAPVRAKGDNYVFFLKLTGMGIKTFHCPEGLLQEGCLSLVEGQEVYFRGNPFSQSYTHQETKEKRWYNYFLITEMHYGEALVDHKKKMRIAELQARQEADQKELQNLMS